MAHRNQVSGWLSAVLLGAVAYFLTAAPAAAQCVLCYISAAGSGDRGIRTLQIGILILMIPTVSILAGLFWITVRRRHADPVVPDGSEMDTKWEEELTALRVSPEPQNLSRRA